MRKLSLRILVALITLMISLSSSWLLHHLLQPKPTLVDPAPRPTPLPAPQCMPEPYVDPDDEAEYPDENDLSPWNIRFFIDAHPRAKLKKLWERLHLKDGENAYSDFSECGDCTARVDEYDLDMKPGDEVILKISDEVRESYRYLVFKQVAESNDWRLIGHVDEWGKYKDSESFVLVSGGRAWLVTQGQSASGSGVAYYHNRVFAVTSHRLKEVASYECEGSQSGIGEWPSKWFTTRVLDVQDRLGVIRVKVEFDVNYSAWTSGDKDLLLFSKRQVAVFVSSNNSASVLNQTDSTVTQRELDHIYKDDSMTEHDFFKYNLSELLNLAKRGTKPQKNWLRDFLKTCDSSAEKQRLLAALAN